MSPSELRAIRIKLGLSLLEMGRAIGYEGAPQTVKTTLHRYETGERSPIPPWISRLAYMYGQYGIPVRFRDGPQNALDSPKSAKIGPEVVG